jgi:hypothetical protein
MLDHSLLLSDLYQLSMLEAYSAHGMTETAVFELFVRKLPRRRSFLLAAGLEQIVSFLEGLRYSAEEIDWLRSSSMFFARLRRGSGRPAIYRRPRRDAGRLGFLPRRTSAAANGAAAPGAACRDAPHRRAHGAEAGILAARASFLAGFAGTAAIAANREFGIPIGPWRISFVQAAGRPRRKRSEGKATWPGRKQVYRQRGAIASGDAWWPPRGRSARSWRGLHPCRRLPGAITDNPSEARAGASAGAHEYRNTCPRGRPGSPRFCARSRPHTIASTRMNRLAIVLPSAGF